MGSKLILRVSLTTLSVLTLSTLAWAGIGGGLGGRGAVGGVLIDSAGVVRDATVDEQQGFAAAVREVLDMPAGDLTVASELRIVSLKGLQEAILASRRSGRPLADDVSLLAGLQRVTHVFVDDHNADILIAGPAEPWKLTDDGSIVGTVTGGSTLRLDDLAAALRSVEMSRDGGITCSIEPTDQGRKQLQDLLSRATLAPGQDPSFLVPAMREAFGPQDVKLNGVPGRSRLARTLVAADFEMKRLAMGLIDSPVAGLPSYLEMARNKSQSKSQNPRWWMACDYDPLGHSEDRTAWHIRGPGVKTMTDIDMIDENGNATAAGRQDKVARRWADAMTQRYGELSQKMSVFSDLRNAMDLAVVATLIAQENLDDAAGIDLTVLASDSDSLQLDSYFVPTMVPPHCSFIQGVAGWTVTASGGVDINAFDVVANQTSDPAAGKVRTAALASKSDRWWWNK